ncbi:AMP-binding protein [Streptomyces sp. NRRL F-5727]|uniref:AMP-binding protein n=1 Tax=Streptomyces sp. NRRL F-5727 TaxID=1463871 RepID=UPI00069164CE|nr:AMP-binding protein [Streptomyces sp. NRRL F-5727]
MTAHHAAAGPLPALGDLLAGPARRWPDRVAIDDGRVRHTFAELEQGALKIAAWLEGQGVGPGDRVVVLTETRPVMPMIILGIWKRGAVHVPVDGTEPDPRLHALLDRIRPAAVITPPGRPPVLPGVPMLDGEALVPVLFGPAVPHTTVAHGPEDIAYVVFASGATGEPQGAEITAAGLLAHFTGHNEVLGLTPDSRVLSLSPFHFDVSLLDTLLPLSVGAFVHQFRGLPAGAVLRATLARQHITHLVAVTMLLGLITDDGRHINRDVLPSLDVVMTGAQVCPPHLLRSWARGLPGIRLVQAFGPPEATIFGLTHTVRAEDVESGAPCPVGRPLRGTLAKLVRDGAEVRGPGAEGELWIGGPQVMRGYFDQPEETARLVVEADGTRWFRTGDVCAYDDGGALVLRRHADDRITWLAGRRTHLYEIERAALSCPAVERVTAAVVRRGPRDVVALAVAAKDAETLHDVAHQLRGLLPEPLRPAVLVRTVPGHEPDAPLLAQRLTAVDPTSSPYLDMSADGAVEPFDDADKEEI